MADKTIGDLQAVSVGDLPLAPDIYDDTKIPIEQSGEAKHMTGAQWKAYAESAAAESADAAEQARQGAEAAQQGAEAAKDAAEFAKTAAETAANNASNSATEALTAKNEAESAKNAAAGSANAAQNGANAAAQSAGAANTAKTAAQEAAGAAQQYAENASQSAAAAAESAGTLSDTIADVTQLKKDLDDLYSYDEEVEIDKSVTGYYDLSVGVGNTVGEWKSSGGYAQRKIEARYGNKFYIYGEGGASPRLWAFADADDKIISVAEASTIVYESNPITISAPANTKYAYFTVQITKKFRVLKSVPKYDKPINELDVRVINNKTEIDSIKSSMYTKVDVDSFVWESGLIQSNGVDAGSGNSMR